MRVKLTWELKGEYGEGDITGERTVNSPDVQSAIVRVKGEVAKELRVDRSRIIIAVAVMGER